MSKGNWKSFAIHTAIAMGSSAVGALALASQSPELKDLLIGMF